MTDDLFRGSEAETRDTTRLPRISARLNWISIPAARRLLAMRRSALPSAFGALGQRTERRMPSLIMQVSRACSSVTVPLKPSWASSATGSYSGEDSSARLSTGDFRPALAALLGEDAAGLSPTNITRLTTCWEQEYTAFRQRELAGREYVYVWVDGVHFNIRLEDDRLCTLVMIGARPDGEKELLAVEDGYRESAESWKTLLRDLKRRGMAAPVVAVGDGALGFWAAAREVWPETRAQGCWCHKLANVLDKLPKRLQPRAKRALHEMMYAERRTDCEAARTRFEAEYQPKYSKAVESLTAHWERLVTFFDFPAEHWKHLRTTNVIESPFATVRLRERATRGAGSRTKGLLMAFKLLEMAQLRWRHMWCVSVRLCW